MATYREIQNYVREEFNVSVKTCWIAHVKELNGLSLRKAPNRISRNTRVYPCPTDKQLIIEKAMVELGILNRKE